MTVKVLLVGEGAREHGLAEAICRSRYQPRLYAVMSLNNPGINRLTKQTSGEILLANSRDAGVVVKAASKFHVDFAVVGPEEPLFHGVADELERAGIPCIGAKQAPAQIEMSKAFMRRLMWKHRIPGRLRFKAFLTVEDAVAYLHEYAESVALKPARQAGGRGVKVIADLQAYLTREKTHVKDEHAKEIYDKHMRGWEDIEEKILIEERVEGPEYTVQTFTDGRTVKALPIVQDNKNAFDMDIGPETGGMGSISGPGLLLPFLNKDEYAKSVEIVQASVRAIHRETGTRYKGVISGQMMLTAAWGPTIIEFYSRLGDPEAINVLPLLKTDFIELCEAIVDEKLNKLKMEFDEKATVVKCIAPAGYPDKRDIAKGHPVRVDEAKISRRGGKLYYASTDLDPSGGITTGGSRVGEIFAAASDIPKAGDIAESCVPFVSLKDGWPVFHRKDIGSRVLLGKRISQAELIRKVYIYRKSRNLIGKTIEWIPKKGKLVLTS